MTSVVRAVRGSLSVHGKVLEPGFPEADPLICTLAVWGQGPVFPRPELLGTRHGEWLPSGGCQLAGVLSFLSALSVGAAIAGACDILCLLMWQEMSRCSLLVRREL